MDIVEKIWSVLPESENIKLIRMTNRTGAFVELTNWGATWVSACMPDRENHLGEVLLGYPSFEGYQTNQNYMGSTIGRFANRINKAIFKMAGKTFFLEKNDGENSNHGGFSGFHRRIWKTECLSSGVRFILESHHGDGGYPGNLKTEVIYSFSEDNVVTVEFIGTCDQETPLNLTNHAYFNLSGAGSALNHWLWIGAQRILESRQDFIPTGRFLDVLNSPFDFTSPRRVGERIFDADRQLGWNRGYNHCYLLDRSLHGRNAADAVLWDKSSGRRLVVKTTYPGLLLYTANFLSDMIYGKNKTLYQPYEGICLETQFFPDTPNHTHFPSCFLKVGEIYHHVTSFEFNIFYVKPNIL